MINKQDEGKCAFGERGRKIASQTKVCFVFYREIDLCMADEKDSFQ
jgi:hypothetical protein